MQALNAVQQQDSAAPLTPGSAWKSFVSPSLFTAGLDSPSVSSPAPTSHHGRVTSSMHEREINPFSDAFGYPPTSTLTNESVTSSDNDLGQMLTRKRTLKLANSTGSNAINGNSSFGMNNIDSDEMALRDMKRPRLAASGADSATDQRSAPNDESAHLSTTTKTSTVPPVPARTDTTSSSDASSGGGFAFDDATTSAESKAATESPASSTAPSPKPHQQQQPPQQHQNNLIEQLQSQHAHQQAQQQSQRYQQQQSGAGSAFHHYQPAPLPMRYGQHGQPQVSMNVAGGPSDYYTMETTVAPSATMPAAFAPIADDDSSTIDPMVSAYDMNIISVAYPHPTTVADDMLSAPTPLSLGPSSVASSSRRIHMPVSQPSSTPASSVRAPIMSGAAGATYMNVQSAVNSATMASHDSNQSSPASSAAPTPAPTTSAQYNMKTGAGAAAVQTGPRKRGRKPKVPDPNASLVDPEIEKAAALERNRIAASKSRLRKKERVHNLEQTAADLSQANSALQATCHALQQELASLRQLLATNHPSSLCTCTHVQGYLRRESSGGGIPAIERLAGDALHKTYTGDDGLETKPNVPDMSIKETAVLAHMEAQSKLAAQQAVAVHHQQQQQQQVVMDGRPTRRGRSASSYSHQQQQQESATFMLPPPAHASPPASVDVERQLSINLNAIPIRRSSRV
ncbi:hypothetical protein ACM66B_004391 [Microbotryomycetes sp. NB124-2]